MRFPLICSVMLCEVSHNYRKLFNLVMSNSHATVSIYQKTTFDKSFAGCFLNVVTYKKFSKGMKWIVFCLKTIQGNAERMFQLRHLFFATFSQNIQRGSKLGKLYFLLLMTIFENNTNVHAKELFSYVKVLTSSLSTCCLLLLLLNTHKPKVPLTSFSWLIMLYLVV